MTSLERFYAICRFEKVDRPIRWESLGFWGDTVERWKKEGLPEDISLSADAEEYLGMEPREYLSVNSGFSHVPLDPPFEERKIAETDTTITWTSPSGGIVERSKKNPGIRHWLEYPVKDWASWKEIKSRLSARKREYPDWNDLRKKYEDFPYPLCLTICGAYGMPRNLFGVEGLSVAYFEDPGLVHDIASHWLSFYKELTSIVIKNIRVDYILFWEDMAYKNGPLISPVFFREFMSPYYDELIKHLKGLGISIFMVDSDGNNDVLLDGFIETGVNAMMPWEVAAGEDIIKVRERYGKNLVIMGGIDKRELFKDKRAIKKEVLSKVPVMLEQGGYIPCIDHSAPPEISLENFKYYLSLVRGIKC